MMKPMSILVGAAFALAVPAAFAESSGGPPLNQQSQDWGKQVAQRTRMNEQATTPTAFDDLDLEKAGHVTWGEAKSNPWLSRNFRRCDADQNGEVSRAEYAACTARH